MTGDAYKEGHLPRGHIHESHPRALTPVTTLPRAAAAHGTVAHPPHPPALHVAPTPPRVPGFDDPAEVRRLHRDIVESRNTSIRTDQQVKGLLAEVKRLSAEVDRGDRHGTARFVVAYVVFAACAVAFAWVASGLRAENAEGEVAALREKLRGVEETRDRLAEREQAWRFAEVRTQALYQLVEQGDAEAAVREFEGFDPSLVSRTTWQLLSDRIRALKLGLARRLVEEGRRSYQVGSHKNAVSAFERAERYAEEMEHLEDLHYYKGLALYKLKRHDAAIAAFERVAALNPKYEHADYARYLKGLCMTEAGNPEAASAFLERVLSEKLGGEYTALIQRHVQTLTRTLAAARKVAK